MKTKPKIDKLDEYKFKNRLRQYYPRSSIQAEKCSKGLCYNDDALDKMEY